jgi:CO/xanthine dehydrogenase FAD-binding subunit
MRAFDYARPATVAEAVDLLARHHTGARVLAGGTDLIVGLRHGTVTPALVVDVKGVRDLPPPVEVRGGTVVVSAGTVMSGLVDDPRIRRALPALVEAMNTVGSIQIRNRATLAGNVCNASPAADTVPPMLLHDAHVLLAGPDGVRRSALGDVILGPGRTSLRRGELVTAVELALPSHPLGTAFARMTRRRGVDLATVSLCCGVDEAGTVRFAYGAVGPRAFLVADESGTLADPEAPPPARDAVLDGLISQAAPISDVRASREYRLAMLRVLSKRALAVAIGRLRRAGRDLPPTRRPER